MVDPKPPTLLRRSPSRAIAAYHAGGEEGTSVLRVANWMFGDNADAVRAEEQPKWQKWLEALEVPV